MAVVEKTPDKKLCGIHNFVFEPEMDVVDFSNKYEKEGNVCPGVV